MCEVSSEGWLVPGRRRFRKENLSFVLGELLSKELKGGSLDVYIDVNPGCKGGKLDSVTVSYT